MMGLMSWAGLRSVAFKGPNGFFDKKTGYQQPNGAITLPHSLGVDHHAAPFKNCHDLANEKILMLPPSIYSLDNFIYI